MRPSEEQDGNYALSNHRRLRTKQNEWIRNLDRAAQSSKAAPQLHLPLLLRLGIALIPKPRDRPRTAGDDQKHARDNDENCTKFTEFH